MLASLAQLLSQLSIWLSRSVLFIGVSCNQRLAHILSGSLPGWAFWRHVGENFLWLGVWDGNDVFVEWRCDFLHVCLLPDLSGGRAALVVGFRGGGEADRVGGAKCRAGDWKGRGEPRFGAGDCWVVTLQEILIHLVVSLQSGEESVIILATGKVVNSLWTWNNK